MKSLFAIALAFASICTPVLAAPGDYETIHIHDIAGGKKLFAQLIKRDAGIHRNSVSAYYVRDTSTCKILVHELANSQFEGNLTCNSPNARPLHYNLQGSFRLLNASIGRKCKSPQLLRSGKRSHTVRVTCEDKEITGTFTLP